MSFKKILIGVGALVCLALGFIAAQQVERSRHAERATALEQRYTTELTQARTFAEQWADAVASSQGATVLRAFAAGILPSVLAARREGIEIAAVSLLRVPGVVGIHVLSLDGEVLYSSDAKLTTTGEVQERGEWALQATELTSRPSARSGVMEYATPISNAGSPLAVAWLEYDVAGVRSAARPAAAQ